MIQKASRAIMVATALALLAGCAKEQPQPPQRLPHRFEFKERVGKEEFERAVHVHDITGDNVPDTYQIDLDNNILVWAGRYNETTPWGMEPQKYSILGFMGPVESGSTTSIPRARRTTIKGVSHLELLIPYKDKVLVYEIIPPSPLPRDH